MPRRRRGFGEGGACCHVTQRCINGEYLLKFKCDRRNYIRRLGEGLSLHAVSLLAYVVTSNHSHLLLWSQCSSEIAGLMQYLSGTTAQDYNRRKNRHGAYWGDRYHVTLVQSGNVDPGPGMHAWMPAITVDGQGNMGIGVSLGGPEMYFGAAFTGRLATDPPGDTVLPVSTMIEGQGNYDTTGGGGGRNRWGDYTGISIDPSDDATFWIFNEYATNNNNWATHVGAFQLQEPIDEDWYQFLVDAGDTITLQTYTPGDGPLEFVNLLDPRIELYGPSGMSLLSDDNSAGDDHNARIVHVASESGSYRVRVTGVDGEGEYFLSVDLGDSTAGNAAPEVIDVDPDDGQKVAAFPSS